MTADEERIDKVLDSLSHARTALDDPGGLSIQATAEVANQFGDRHDGWSLTTDALKAYAIDKIDDAMRLLSPEKMEPMFMLQVTLGDKSIGRLFEAEEEAIEAIGEAIEAKRAFPDHPVRIVIGRVDP